MTEEKEMKLAKNVQLLFSDVYTQRRSVTLQGYCDFAIVRIQFERSYLKSEKNFIVKCRATSAVKP